MREWGRKERHSVSEREKKKEIKRLVIETGMGEKERKA